MRRFLDPAHRRRVFLPGVVREERQEVQRRRPRSAAGRQRRGRTERRSRRPELHPRRSWFTASSSASRTSQARNSPARPSTRPPPTRSLNIEDWTFVIATEAGEERFRYADDASAAATNRPQGERHARQILLDLHDVGMRAIDDHTIEFTLENPTPYFLNAPRLLSALPRPAEVRRNLRLARSGPTSKTSSATVPSSPSSAGSAIAPAW